MKPIFNLKFSAAFAIIFAKIVHLSAIAAPVAPTARFDVRTYGAKGDGHTLDTVAINRAIGAAGDAGGGTVVLSPGTYLSASIRLRDNITLLIEAGAVLEAASEKVAHFDPPEFNEWEQRSHYQDFGHSHWHNSLIWGVGVKNVAIIGPGLIYGKGLDSGLDRFADETKGQRRYRANPEYCGNKAIALCDCKNIVLRDFSVLHGGWFGVLATGVNNLTIDNLKIDTNRDGMDIDACQNVRVTRCSVNSPWDDGICLKASYSLGIIRNCANITISDCYIAGNFEEGTLIDGTFRHCSTDYKSYRTGRIKLGTESNGDFTNIAIANCIFDDCRGIAIESVDGSHIEDVVISNITMRHVANSPIFIRLGCRMRGPAGTPVGTIRRISIDHLNAFDVDENLGCIIAGIPAHPVQDVQLSNIRLVQRGGGAAELSDREPPEEEKAYPEPGMFGKMPCYGLFVRHARNIGLSDVSIEVLSPDARPACVLDDVQNASFDSLEVPTPFGSVPRFDLRNVTSFSLRNCPHLPDIEFTDAVSRRRI